jgi:hypothetical protein
MAKYHDSLGNVYDRLPANKPQPGAKPTTETSMRRSSRRKNPRTAKINKHERYRMNRGKPNGPGRPGNKSGKNKIR